MKSCVNLVAEYMLPKHVTGVRFPHVAIFFYLENLFKGKKKNKNNKIKIKY